MSKARVTWAFQERPVSSTKMNQVVIDYITPAVPIWSYYDSLSVADSVGVASIAPRGFFPYNPQKSVYDRLYVIGAASIIGTDQTSDFDLTFDGGSTWVPAFPSLTGAPVVMISTFTLAEVWNLDVQVATFQWIGWRITEGMPGGSSGAICFQGFLYNSANTPF
jgi:hypothetical protein